MLEGALSVEFKGGAKVILNPMESLVVDAGVIHRTEALGRTVNLLVERNDAETVFEESTS